MEHKTAGARIRELRERKAWTQEHLAEASQLSVRTVQRAEEGVMSAETATALAGALDEPVEELLRQEPPFPTIVPIIYYHSSATLDWLVDAFGFELKEKMLGPSDAILHAELSLGDGVIMVGAPVPDRAWKTPNDLSCVATQSTMVRVSDVDTHYQRALAAGATVLVELEESYGLRRYRVEDPEGHVWTFCQQLAGR